MPESMEISAAPAEVRVEQSEVVAIAVADDSDTNVLEISNNQLPTIDDNECLETNQLPANDATESATLCDSSNADNPKAENIGNASEEQDKNETGIHEDPSITVEPQIFRYEWNVSPRLLCSSIHDYVPTETSENYTKGCQWSPDGTCLLVPAEDFRIRVYELPRELYNGKVTATLPLDDFKPALSVREGGLIYDSCWYPLMNSWEPATCCFLSTSRESPLHLWDAFTGELRATYRPYNQVDEVEAAMSVQFVNGGQEVWCGFKGALRSFDTDRPGRQKETISLKNEFPNVTGLVSCIRENPAMPGLIAFGTYSKCIGLYRDGPLCSLKTDSGVTQLEFSPCGMKLYSAVRRSDEFLCWDLRNPGVVLHSMQTRRSNTNQRIQFAVSGDGSEVVSGGTDGFVGVWRPSTTVEQDEELFPLSRYKLSNDCVNGVSMHKSLPILATSSGQRLCDDQLNNRDNSVRLWYFQGDR